MSATSKGSIQATYTGPSGSAGGTSYLTPKAQAVPSAGTATMEHPKSWMFAIPIFSPVDHAKARFRMLRHLDEDHDGEGAAKPNPASIDNAIAFLSRAGFESAPMASVDDNGNAVLEFKAPDKAYVGDVRFVLSSDGGVLVECYSRNAPTGSKVIERPLDDVELKSFLAKHLSVAVID